MRSSKSLKNQHELHLKSLKKRYYIHSRQISNRHYHLALYDFKKYNLKDSLVPQYEIEI